MPARSTPRRDDEVLKGEITIPALPFPVIKSRMRHAVGLFALAQIQEGFPHHPLVGKPDGTVPVTIHFVVGGGLVYGRQADRRPQFIGREEMSQQPFRLGGGTDTCHEGRHAVQTTVEVGMVRITENVFGITQGIVYYIPVIAAFLVPRVSL